MISKISRVIKDMTEKEKEILMESFQTLANNSDVIKQEHIYQYLRSTTKLDDPNARKRAKWLIKKMDTENKGEISFKDFVRANTLTKLESHYGTKSEIQLKSLQVLDPNGTGTIDSKTLETELNESMSNREKRKFVKKLVKSTNSVHNKNDNNEERDRAINEQIIRNARKNQYNNLPPDTIDMRFIKHIGSANPSVSSTMTVTTMTQTRHIDEMTVAMLDEEHDEMADSVNSMNSMNSKNSKRKRRGVSAGRGSASQRYYASNNKRTISKSSKSKTKSKSTDHANNSERHTSSGVFNSKIVITTKSGIKISYPSGQSSTKSKNTSVMATILDPTDEESEVQYIRKSSSANGNENENENDNENDGNGNGNGNTSDKDASDHENNDNNNNNNNNMDQVEQEHEQEHEQLKPKIQPQITPEQATIAASSVDI